MYNHIRLDHTRPHLRTPPFLFLCWVEGDSRPRGPVFGAGRGIATGRSGPVPLQHCNKSGVQPGPGPTPGSTRRPACGTPQRWRRRGPTRRTPPPRPAGPPPPPRTAPVPGAAGFTGGGHPPPRGRLHYNYKMKRIVK